MRNTRGFNLNAIWFLIIANTILFIATSVNSDLVYDLGLARVVFGDEPWRIVTSLFIHNDFLHLLFNMMTLYFFGTFLSRLIGENKFLIVYFLGGLSGNAFYMLLGDSHIIVIGASGAIFAVAGALMALLPKLRVMIFPIPTPLPLWVALLGMFFIILVFPNVAWQAHLGGLLLGLLAGYYYRKRLRFLR